LLFAGDGKFRYLPMYPRYNVCDAGSGVFLRYSNIIEVKDAFFTPTFVGHEKLVPSDAANELTDVLYVDYRNTKSCLCNSDGTGRVVAYIEGDHI
jgi:hypothetical protein